MIYALIIGLPIALGLAFSWVVAGQLSAPARRTVPLPADVRADAVTLASKSGATLAAWVLAPENPRAVVVLCHGVRSSRADLLARGKFLWQAGYAVVMFDFQAHGESTGERITFGYLESRDVATAVTLAKQRFPGRRVAVLGTSLGGAAALLSTPALEVDALVLEQVYPTIEEAIEDRLEMRLGKPGRLLAPLLTLQLKPRLGCCADDLCPIRRAAENRVPKLFIAAADDRHTTIAESRELFRRAAEPKELWEVPGAAHVDLHGFSPAAYEARILDFFQKHLR